VPQTRTTLSVKRARTNKDNQEEGENKRLRLASVFNASVALSQTDSRTSRQISSKDCDAMRIVQMAFLAVNAESTVAKSRRRGPSQDHMPLDPRIELNCAPPYSRSINREIENTRMRDGSKCTDQQPSATELPGASVDKNHSTKSSNKSGNHLNDSQPSSITLLHTSQEPLNSIVPTSFEDDPQILVSSPSPLEFQQNPRRLQNVQDANSPS
jgi:hypothetical protein